MPAALPQMLAALDATVTEPVQIVLAGQRDLPETAELLRVIRKRYLPNKVVLLADGGEGQNWLAAAYRGAPADDACARANRRVCLPEFRLRTSRDGPRQFAELLERL